MSSSSSRSEKGKFSDPDAACRRNPGMMPKRTRSILKRILKVTGQSNFEDYRSDVGGMITDCSTCTVRTPARRRFGTQSHTLQDLGDSIVIPVSPRTRSRHMGHSSQVSSLLDLAFAKASQLPLSQQDR